MQEVSEETARSLGPFVEHHEMFPNRINMQIVHVLDRDKIDIRIWERGAGYTLASGSSSCAAAAACHKLGLVDDEIAVLMPGGTLRIQIDRDGQIYMTGPVQGTFEGQFHEDLANQIRIMKPEWPIDSRRGSNQSERIGYGIANLSDGH
jgi:diaminopimelate epimerase